MLLDNFLKKQFYHQDYLVILDVIPLDRIKKALKAINVSLGKGLTCVKLEQYEIRFFCQELMKNLTLMDIYSKTPAYKIAESCIGPGKLKNIHEVQIALRFPGAFKK